MNPNDTTVLHIADDALNFRNVLIPHLSPTGAQILEAAGASNPEDIVLLQILSSGGIESIRPKETPNLQDGTDFILSTSDRCYFFSIDGSRYEWPHRHISAFAIREVGQVPEELDLVLQHQGGEFVVLTPTQLIDLGSEEVERISTRPQIWKLKVQGVVLEYDLPHVKVAEAMRRAGFDPTKAWHIYLIVAGQPKREVDAEFVVDLRTPGLEKIRLMQRNVDNGDGQQPKARREVELLAVDERYLNGTSMFWETIANNGRRWLLIHDYQLLPGYVPAASVLALDIPADYPAAQIDMFYFAPAIARRDGQAIPSTQVTATIDHVVYQGWSRHRNSFNPWDPHTDNVATHLALVETCLAREFGE